MAFTITQEDFTEVPASTWSVPKVARPAPFGLDKLEIGKSAFIPLSANPTAAKHAEKNTTKGCQYLANYITNRFRVHRDLKGRKIAIRREGLGVRVYRIS